MATDEIEQDALPKLNHFMPGTSELVDEPQEWEEEDEVNQLRERAGKVDELAQAAQSARHEAEVAKCEVALLRSGVDYSSKFGQYYLKVLPSINPNPTVEELRADARLYGLPIRTEEEE